MKLADPSMDVRAEEFRDYVKVLADGITSNTNDSTTTSDESPSNARSPDL